MRTAFRLTIAAPVRRAGGRPTERRGGLRENCAPGLTDRTLPTSDD
jgi:hypothetical protein